MKRGEIWWINLDPTLGSEIKKTRPCIILTHDALNKARRTVVVVPLSTGAEPRPPIVIAMASAGQDSSAVCDQIRAVDKQRLIRQSGKISLPDLQKLEDGVRQILSL